MTPHSTPIPSPVPVRTPSEPDEAARDADASAGSDEASRDAAPHSYPLLDREGEAATGWRAQWCSRRGRLETPSAATSPGAQRRGLERAPSGPSRIAGVAHATSVRCGRELRS